MEAMPLMHGLLASRPAGFESIEEAVEWQYVHKAYLLPMLNRGT